MNDALSLIERHRGRGLVVDANILLLRLIGALDRALIPQFKHTQQFTADDYYVLVRLTGQFVKVVTTPNILTEVNGLSLKIKGARRRAYFARFADAIGTLEERYAASAEIAASPRFAALGLTDCGILHVAQSGYLVLTDDLDLYLALSGAGLAVVNFNHIRGISWS